MHDLFYRLPSPGFLMVNLFQALKPPLPGFFSGALPVAHLEHHDFEKEKLRRKKQFKQTKKLAPTDVYVTSKKGTN